MNLEQIIDLLSKKAGVITQAAIQAAYIDSVVCLLQIPVFLVAAIISTSYMVKTIKWIIRERKDMDDYMILLIVWGGVTFAAYMWVVANIFYPQNWMGIYNPAAKVAWMILQKVGR